MTIGTAYPRDSEVSMTCRGRDLMTGLPEAVEITSADMLEAMEEPLSAICEAIHSILKIVPPELAADIGNSGVYLSGGSSLLHNMDKMIQVKTGIRVIRLDNPMECVAIGTGKALENITKVGMNYQQANSRNPY